MATTRFENISSFAADFSGIIGVVSTDGSLAVISGGNIHNGGSVPQVTGIQKIAFNNDGLDWHGLALNGAGVVTGWSRDGWHGAGAMPALVNGSGPVQDIAAGYRFSLFLRDGAVGGWGRPSVGIPSQIAQPETFSDRVVKIAAAGNLACALLEGGGLIAWLPRSSGSEFTNLAALPSFPGGITHLAVIRQSSTASGVNGVGILSGGRFYKTSGVGGSFNSWVESFSGGFTNIWGGQDNFVLRNQSVRSTGDDLYCLTQIAPPMPEVRTRNVSQAYVSGSEVWALTDDGAMWTTSTLAERQVQAGPIHVYEPAAATGSVAALLDLKLADCTALFESSAALSGAIFGFENIAPTFTASASCAAVLAGGGAVVLEASFVGVSGFVAKSAATVQVADLLQTYTGAGRAVTVSTIPMGLQGSVVVRYNGSLELPVAAGAYQVDAVLDTADYFGVASGQLVIQKAAQTINWQTLQDRKLGDAPFPLFANSSSGLAISYTSSNTLLATLAGNIVTLRGVGQVTLTAYQQGSVNYLAAPAVSRTLLIAAAPPAISNAQGALVLGVGQNFFFQFKASNNPTQWLLTPDAILPPGFLFNPLAGTLAGTGIEPGIYRIGVIARNSAGDSAPNEFTFGIFETQTLDVVKKVTINTDSWDVSFPDPFAGANGVGAAVGQLRYGDEVTFQVAFAQGVTSGTGVAATTTYNPPLVQARFSLKGLDSEPAFLVTGEPEFKNITSFTPSGYTGEVFITVSLKNDALLAFLSDFEADSGTHATCIGEFELVFRRSAKAGGGFDTISTRPFSMRVTRGLF